MLTGHCTTGQDQGRLHLAELLNLDQQEEREKDRREVQGGEWNAVIVTLALSARTRNHCLFSKNFSLMHYIEFLDEEKSTQGFQACPLLSLVKQEGFCANLLVLVVTTAHC